ncbi:MAG: hypothetical protein Q8R15_02035, partial [Candidatus Micrarchaeota archaeon]|nr:hypothetical protein [Candidatus Micrarchaeota archaeon]
MTYKLILAAVALILIVILLPTYLSQQGTSVQGLTEQEVIRTAENYVSTTLPNVTVTGASVTNNQSGVWKVTINYEQRTVGQQCKVGKCYWEGPASMFCRIESNQTLGI